MSSYIPMAKLAAQVVAGLGVSKIAGDIIKNNVAVVTTAQSVMVKAGTFVIGSMLWEQSSNHIERQTEELLETYRKWKDKETPTEE